MQFQIDEEECRQFQVAAELAGKKWTASILMAAARGAERFSDYRSMVAGVSDRLLSLRLRELEREQLMIRTVIATTPVQVRYSLTPKGMELIQGLHPLVQWGNRWGSKASPSRI
jgi:DNA-binding HxlR family transcriptional regulator